MSRLLTEVRRVIYGEAKVSAAPGYWRTADVTTDDGALFTVRALSRPLYADSVGGEAVFREAVLQLGQSMSGTFKVTPYLNGSAADVTDGATVTVSIVPVTFQLAQQTSDELRPVTVIVPLVRRLLLSGVEHSRYYLRGQSLQLLVERVGPLGSGLLAIDGCRVYYEPVRRTDHQLGVTA